MIFLHPLVLYVLQSGLHIMCATSMHPQKPTRKHYHTTFIVAALFTHQQLVA